MVSLLLSSFYITQKPVIIDTWTAKGVSGFLPSFTHVRASLPIFRVDAWSMITALSAILLILDWCHKWLLIV